MSFRFSLSRRDAARVSRVLETLRLHGLRRFAIAGSLALEANLIMRGNSARHRELNDLDIVVESFASIPFATADSGLLIRHIHPTAPEGKILVQLVDADNALRIDVFRSFGATLMRSTKHRFGAGEIAVVSLEDLTARSASLVLALEEGSIVPAKHVEAFERVVQLIDPRKVESVWPEHRKQKDPGTFREAVTRIRELVQSRKDLLVASQYSQDVAARCPKCAEVGPFRLASPARMMTLLGYC